MSCFGLNILCCWKTGFGYPQFKTKALKHFLEFKIKYPACLSHFFFFFPLKSVVKLPFLQGLFLLHFLADYSTVGGPKPVCSLWERIKSIKMNLQLRINYIISVLLQIFLAYPDLRNLHFYINCLNKTTKGVLQKIKHVSGRRERKKKAKTQQIHKLSLLCPVNAHQLELPHEDTKSLSALLNEKRFWIFLSEMHNG